MVTVTKLYGYPDITLDDAREMLALIGPYEFDFSGWSKLGRALASHFGDSAKDAFMEWNNPGDNTSRKKLESNWKSFLKTRSVNIGSLIQEAQSRGWRFNNGRQLSEQEAQQRQQLEAKRKKAAADREEQDRIQAAKALAKLERQFQSLPLYTGTQSHYLRRKGVANACQFTELRLGKDHNGEPWTAWPLRDAAGTFQGYERLYDSVDQSNKSIKRVGKGSKSAKGWLTLGDLNQAKRAFVVGGFADAIAARASTGESIVSVVGESNIPSVVQQLREHFPDCQFIAAPDNDQAGNRAAQKAGGFWTVPMAIGDDWNDVYLRHGASEVQHQLLNFVRGFEEVRVNQKYLSIKIHEGLNLIRSAKETGKSYSTAEYIKDNPHLKTLIISYRVLLNKALASQFEADFYQDLVVPGTDNQLLKESSRLVITPDSLWRIAGTTWDLVFMDEAEQDLHHFNSATMDNKTFNLDVLAHVLRSSKIQIMADADMSDLTKNFCHEIGLHTGVYHHNEYQPRQESKIYLYENPEHLKRTFTDRIEQGEQTFFCSNSKGAVDDLVTRLRNNGIEDGVHHVTSNNSSDDDVVEMIKNINTEAPDMLTLLGSPSIGTGISIDNHGFEKTFASFSHRSGTAAQAHQQLARARGVTEYHIYVDPKTRREITSVSEIERLKLREPTEETAHFLQLNGEGQVTAHPLFEWLYCQVKSVEADNRNRFKDLFVKQAEAEGYTVVDVAESKAMAKLGKADREGAQATLDKELKEEIQTAEVLTDDQLNSALKGDGDYTHAQVLKSQVFRDWNFAEADPDTSTEELNELAFSEARDGYARQLKKLGLAALPADITRLMDLRNRKHATTRADLIHYSKKKAHLITLLAAAGIDEALEYDGREWSGEVIQKLRKWLIRNKDSLYKYSGVTVTFESMRYPLRWFNGFLRSLGIVVNSRQARVDGKPVHFYSIDLPGLNYVRNLIERRNSGIVDHYTAPDMTLPAVTASAVIVNNNSLVGVTAGDSCMPHAAGALAYSEERNKAEFLPEFSVPEGTDRRLDKDLIDSMLAGAIERSGLSHGEALSQLSGDDLAAIESGEISYTRLQALSYELSTSQRRAC